MLTLSKRDILLMFEYIVKYPAELIVEDELLGYS